jgi:phosphoglucomutase
LGLSFANVLDMDAIRGANLKMGVDPLGGAGVHYWDPIAECYGLNLTVVNKPDTEEKA